ncbi:hypothetical protein CR513_37458, partial [Mucuna pruriens]
MNRKKLELEVQQWLRFRLFRKEHKQKKSDFAFKDLKKRAVQLDTGNPLVTMGAKDHVTEKRPLRWKL